MKHSRILKTLVAVACLLAMLLGMTACAATPGARLKKMYQTYLDAALLGVDSYYKLLEAHDPTDMTSQVTLNIVPGASLLTMLQSMAPMDFSWISDLYVHLTNNVKDSSVSASLALAYKDKELISGSILGDQLQNIMFVTVPLLSAQALKLDMSEEEIGLSTMMEQVDYSKVLPEKDQVKNLIKKYYGILMENITSVTQTDGSVTANSISQDCLVYEVVLTQKQVADLFLDVMNALAEDTEIKDILYKMLSYTAELAAAAEPGSIPTAEEGYAEFISGLTEAITSTEESLANGEITDDPMITWTTYATKKSKILGCDFLCTDEESNVHLFFASAGSDGVIGQEFSMTEDGEQVFAVKGNLNSEKDVLGGSYELFSEGKSMAFIDVAGIDTKKLIAGTFNGSVTLSPSAGMLEIISQDMGMDPTAAALLSAYSIKLSMEQSDKDHAKLTTTILSGDAEFLTITMDSSVSKGTAVTLPTDYVEDPTVWGEGLDLNALNTAIQESGLPQDVVAMLQALLAGLMG